MVFSYIKSKSKPISFYVSSASFGAERVSLSPPVLGLVQNLTSKLKPQWPQSLLLSRTGFYNSNGNVPTQTSSTSTTHGERVNLRVLVGMCLFFMIRLERIPYTERLHFTVSSSCEKDLSKLEKLEKFEKELIGEILPPSDPRVIRVQSIARNMIEGINKGLMLQGQPRMISENARQKRRWLPGVKHLDGKVWEIYVSDKDIDNALCTLNGKIVIYAGLLEHLESDEEIATVIGHEMGHAVARHVGESILRGLVLRTLPIFLLSALERVDNSLEDIFFKQRMEVEADYIGLMLMASAGYDPQVAPKFYENWPSCGGSLEPAHPPGNVRAHLLREPKTMELAKQVYEDVKAGNRITSFV